MNSLLQDLRYGARMLLKNPGFTLVAVLTLGLGIAVNTTIFSAANSLLFRPLLVKEPARLVVLWATNPARGLNEDVVSVPDFTDWKESSRSLDSMTAAFGAAHYLTGVDQPVRVSGYHVSADLFPLLGVQPMLGRTFLPEEDRPNTSSAVILSYGLWERRFGANPNIIGQAIKLDGESYTVIGIMPRNFTSSSVPVAVADLWLPLAIEARQADRGRRFLMVMGRLKPGANLEQSRAEMATIARQIGQLHPETNTGWGVNVEPLILMGRATKAIWGLLVGAVMVVLLIACANVANLQLARATARQKEIAIRAALGASQGRLVRLLFIESVFLSLIGGALGVLMAGWGLDLLRTAYAGIVPLIEEISIDGRVLGFTYALSLLTAVIFGLGPALQVSKPDLQESLKEGGRGELKGGRGRRIRGLLAVAEISLAFVLLIIAGLMIRTLIAFNQVEPGFDPKNLLTMRLSLPESKYPEAHQATTFYQQALERIANLPGVHSVSAISRLPVVGSRRNPTTSLMIEGQPAPTASDKPWAADLVVSPGYFQTLGIPLLRGRDLSTQDSAEAPPVAVISQTMARRYWPNADPIGRRIKLGDAKPESQWISVVGVAGDIRNDDIDAPPLPQVYLPLAQHPERSMSLAIRAETEPLGLIEAVRGELQAIDPDQPAYEIQTMDRLLFDDLAPVHVVVRLLNVFAGLALVLAVIGIYGVVSYSVAQRTHEIGIRIALGAGTADVLKLVIRDGMRLILIGVMVGLGVAFAVTRLMSSLLFGVSATDAMTFALVSLLLVSIALLACYVPSRRAMKVDPMVALRCE